MKFLKLQTCLVAAMLLFGAFSASAMANVTTGSWFMDQSNEFSDGINYGQVDITANDSSGNVAFTVDAFVVGSYGTLDNFGIQAFGFNYNTANVTSTPDFWTFNLPTGWLYAGSGTVDGFGYFLVTVDGTGSTRQDPLNFDVTLPTAIEATASNFAVLSTGTAGQGNAYFVAHVAGFELDPGSHWIATIPAPGAIFLGGIGVALVGWLRRRRTL